jgi:succinoglycan biosynthesis transport protein ExoP
VRPSAAEALKAAIRRSIPIVVALVVIGAVGMNILKNVQGARYSATARVFHTNTQLAPALAEIQPAFQDPQRLAQNALQLARAPEPYDRAARQLGESASAVSEATKVGGSQDSDLIAFTAETGDSDRSVRYANTVAAAYVDWRSDLAAGSIRRAISQLEKRLETSEGRERATLLQDLDRLRLLETLNSADAQVIETADTGSKVSPAPVRDTLLGASLGFVLALLLAGAREAFNTRVRSEADVEDALNKPVLASIQTLPKGVGLVTIGRHESRWGDTYALLAANVMQIRGGDKRPTVLAVTSAIAGEGKTTTASNLAVAMALRGQRVVLADFDLRKPSVARIFRIPIDSPGVVQLVDGAAELSSALWTVNLNGAGPASAIGLAWLDVESGNGSSQGGSDGSLQVVPSGGHERGARIARSPAVPRLLSDLGRDADIVILDTPPALATVEMAELSTNVDAVLIVVRHGRVTRRSLLTLNRQTASWRAETIGAVITDAPAEEDEYYYYKE